MRFKLFLEKILDILYYRRCYICAKKCINLFLCEDCQEKIFSNLKFHKVEKFNTTIYCGAPYENELLKVIRGLKYHGKEDFSKILSKIIIETIKHFDIDITDFIVAPVPIHKSRYKKRKYNHMELVAKEVAQHFNIMANSIYFERIKDTPPLYNLSFLERQKTIQNAFSVSEEIKGKNILLIDDIITTGSTIKEISSLVKIYNPQKFIVICVTRSNNCNF